MQNIISWESLKISQLELEQIIQLNLFDSFALEMTNLLILKQTKNKLSFLLSEFALCFLITLLLVPVSLLGLHKWFLHSNQLHSFIFIISVSLAISLLVVLSLNWFLWQQAKKFKSLAIIINKIAGYNRLIQNFQLLTKFNHLSTTINQQNQRSLIEITTTLQTTKDTLINSLELEKYLLQNKQLQSQDRYQLLSNLENDLINCLSLSNSPEKTEYQQLITEAIEIGLSVHQEIRKNITQSTASIAN